MKDPHAHAMVTMAITSYDFTRLAGSTGLDGTKWCQEQPGRFAPMVVLDPDRIADRMPLGTWKTCAWYPSWTAVLMATAFLRSREMRYEVWADEENDDDRRYVIFTDYQSADEDYRPMVQDPKPARSKRRLFSPSSMRRNKSARD